ncbi:MAG: DUF350 domain-containing protein [Aureispira sp.]
MKEYLEISYWGEPFIYMLLCFALFLIGKILYQLLNRGIDVDAEMVDKDNFAFAITQVGYFVGLLLAIVGTMAGSSHESLMQDLFLTFVYGLIAVVLLNIAIIINDKIVFSALDLKKNIVERGNVAVGVVEAGNYIANGLIIYGVLSIEASEVWFALGFWLAAQLILIAVALTYNRLTPYEVFNKIYTGNVAVAVAFAGFLIAIGNIVRYVIEAEHENILDSTIAISIQLGMALLALPIFRWLTDKLLLPKRSITDELVNQEVPNVGVGLVEAFAYISASTLITISL